MDIYQELLEFQSEMEKSRNAGCVGCGGDLSVRRERGQKLSRLLIKHHIDPLEVISFFPSHARRITYINGDGDLLFVGCWTMTDMEKAIRKMKKE